MWRRVLVFASLLGSLSLAHGRTPMQEELAAQLPKYESNPAAPKPATETKEIKNRATLVRLPAAASEPPTAKDRPATAPNEGTKETVVLPQVTVTGKSGPGRERALPRLGVTRPVKDLPALPFETAAARDERLVKKHLTPLDYLFLNRFTLPFIGVPKEARARQMELVSATAATLNEIAESIDSNLWTGRTPEETKQLKEMYYDVYVARPK
jgi:hypothetical protein